MDGRSTNATKEGRLEVCLNNAWGTVCNSSFGYYDAVVACGQLTGFHGEGKGEDKNTSHGELVDVSLIRC